MHTILAVIIAIIVGMSCNIAIIFLNAYVLFPMPEGMDMNDPKQINEYAKDLPDVAFLVVMLAHLAQSFFGAFVSTKLGQSYRAAMGIGVLSLIGGIMSFQDITNHPTWMYLELPLYLVFSHLAFSLAASPASTNVDIKQETQKSE
eukprot:TRINITY_DN7513_c0_g1_i1.p1 TRINITY_DN7513_c0_g1~~TRINITY_DN7513_c0_g1_i1.p1  ORF type:complete len:146 (-),score=35.31 TRINITY_DN7513_c0_g1_i1:230-667(-)